MNGKKYLWKVEENEYTSQISFYTLIGTAREVRKYLANQIRGAKAESSFYCEEQREDGAYHYYCGTERPRDIESNRDHSRLAAHATGTWYHENVTTLIVATKECLAEYVSSDLEDCILLDKNGRPFRKTA